MPAAKVESNEPPRAQAPKSVVPAPAPSLGAIKKVNPKKDDASDSDSILEEIKNIRSSVSINKQWLAQQLSQQPWA